MNADIARAKRDMDDAIAKAQRDMDRAIAATKCRPFAWVESSWSILFGMAVAVALIVARAEGWIQ